ncbi:glutaredoxin 3 [uncultured Brevundimonas sp.]|uniref:glutaredoxin 3 n=1 Tax=uncultured Brevundimonas sp. TaxID=213418 RepID=UPI0025D6786B|nr:glutaredoxin 3 [uncultured Brevundimonas sp.]
MAKVVIYTKPGCPYCSTAIDLLKRKGVDFDEVVASRDAEKKAEMIRRSGGRTTFPQIFIDETHVGGCDDMLALESRGGLDPLLAA